MVCFLQLTETVPIVSASAQQVDSENLIYIPCQCIGNMASLAAIKVGYLKLPLSSLGLSAIVIFMLRE